MNKNELRSRAALGRVLQKKTKADTHDLSPIYGGGGVFYVFLDVFAGNWFRMPATVKTKYWTAHPTGGIAYREGGTRLRYIVFRNEAGPESTQNQHKK